MNVEIKKIKDDRFLYINEYLWMWDLESERRIQEDQAKRAYGDVLIAGYGLGIIQKFLTQNKEVNSIISVELHQEIFDLCLQEYGEIYGDYVVADFFEINLDKKFDCILGDVWPEIHPIFLDDYKKYKATAKKFLKPDGKIIAWGQEYFEYEIGRNQ